MKTVLKIAAAAAVIAVWAARVYQVNSGTLLIHDKNPVTYYGMGEFVSFAEDVSYNMLEMDPHYSVRADQVRVVDSADYLAEIGHKAYEFFDPPERFVVVTLTLKNDGDEVGTGIQFYGMPIIGENFYLFFDNRLTACSNACFNDEYELAWSVGVNPHSEAQLVLVYNLRERFWNSAQWEAPEKTPMWLFATQSPNDRRIRLEIS